MKPEFDFLKAFSGRPTLEIILNTFLYTLVLFAVIKPENSSDNLGIMLKVSFVKPKIMIWFRERS